MAPDSKGALLNIHYYYYLINNIYFIIYLISEINAYISVSAFYVGLFLVMTQMLINPIKVNGSLH